jgi:hypothetical protein
MTNQRRLKGANEARYHVCKDSGEATYRVATDRATASRTKQSRRKDSRAQETMVSSYGSKESS